MAEAQKKHSDQAMLAMAMVKAPLATLAAAHTLAANHASHFIFLLQRLPRPIGWPLLLLLGLPLFVIKYAHRLGTLQGAQQGLNEPETTTSKTRQAWRIAGAVLFGAASSAVIFTGIASLLPLLGVAAPAVFPLALALTVVLGLAELCYTYEILRSWKLRHFKNAFTDLGESFKRLLRKKTARIQTPPCDSKAHLGRSVGQFLGHAIALLAGLGMAAALFLTLPLALPVTAVVASLVGLAAFLDFDGFVPPFFAAFTHNLSWVVQHDLLGKDMPVRDFKHPFGSDTKEEAAQAEQAARLEERWNQATGLRYGAYALIAALTLFVSVATWGVAPGLLGIIGACLAAPVCLSGFHAAVKSLLSLTLPEPEAEHKDNDSAQELPQQAAEAANDRVPPVLSHNLSAQKQKTSLAATKENEQEKKTSFRRA